MQKPEPSPVEQELGMHVYLTGSDGVGGSIKNEVEDFIVDEIPLLPASRDDGHFLICRVTSTNWETNRLIREISRRLQISRKRIGFAGTKDKRGVTSQYMSFEDVDVAAVSSLRISDVSVDAVQRSPRALSLGDLLGNSFRIRIRECRFSDRLLEEKAQRVLSEIRDAGGFLNFFGIQRFGSLRPNTHTVGLKIVRRDFEGAVHAYAGTPSDREGEEVREARMLFDSGAPAGEVLKSMPRVMVFERILLEHLDSNPGDFVGALRKLPQNLLMMFVHALQGKLYNEMISERVTRCVSLNRAVVGDIVLASTEHGLPDRDRRIDVSATNIDAVNRQIGMGNGFISALLLGWESVFAGGPQGEIEREVAERNCLSGQDFIVPEIGECSSSGSRREILAPVKAVSVHADGNDLLLEFSLFRGTYATSLLREIIK